MSIPNPSDGAPGRPASFPYTLAIFATVLYFALVVCAFGFVSLLTDTDVVSQADAGPLVGPIATGSAVVAVLLYLLGIGRRYERDLHEAVAASIGDPVRLPLGRAVLVGIVSYVVYVFAGAFAYSIVTAEVFSIVLFAAGSALSGFAIAVGTLAATISVAYMLVLGSGGEHPARPLWPWER
ncbi:DUF6121 family protein [Mycetocola sp.]|jgi:hypothetical protein|uniref:DUF6121 family protein n=1 Tax=Mycetocola sp. TaxID=1871042 RepID=UPI00262708B8|nr:DUF6121 family protein [Mycetocola sp.]MCU1561522.1 hypothetical protein [Mycetocola sp.]